MCPKTDRKIPEDITKAKNKVCASESWHDSAGKILSGKSQPTGIMLLRVERLRNPKKKIKFSLVFPLIFFAWAANKIFLLESKIEPDFYVLKKAYSLSTVRPFLQKRRLTR